MGALGDLAPHDSASEITAVIVSLSPRRRGGASAPRMRSDVVRSPHVRAPLAQESDGPRQAARGPHVLNLICVPRRTRGGRAGWVGAGDFTATAGGAAPLVWLRVCLASRTWSG